MSTELDKIEEVFPGAKDNDMIVSLTDALSKAKDLRVMARSEAGLTVSKELWNKSLSLVDQLRGTYMTISETELRAICAAIDAQMTLYEELLSAEFIEKAAQNELDQAVADLDGG